VELWSAFETRVSMFTTACALQYFNHETEVIIESEASDYISGRVLPQYGSEGVFHIPLYFSKKHIPMERNYETSHQELMAVINELEEWRP